MLDLIYDPRIILRRLGLTFVVLGTALTLGGLGLEFRANHVERNIPQSVQNRIKTAKRNNQEVAEKDSMLGGYNPLAPDNLYTPEQRELVDEIHRLNKEISFAYSISIADQKGHEAQVKKLKGYGRDIKIIGVPIILLGLLAASPYKRK